MNDELPAISMIPDYRNGTTQSTTFTAPANGFVIVIQQPGSYYGDALVRINNNEVWRFSGSSANISNTAIIPMAKGDNFVYQLVSGNFKVRSLIFYPGKS